MSFISETVMEDLPITMQNFRNKETIKKFCVSKYNYVARYIRQEIAGNILRLISLAKDIRNRSTALTALREVK